MTTQGKNDGRGAPQDLEQETVDGIYEDLRNTVGEPAPWQCLFRPTSDDNPQPKRPPELIEWEVQTVAGNAQRVNPTFGKRLEGGLWKHLPEKHKSAFVSPDDAIPALHDWRVMQVFRKHCCLDHFPRFRRAGEQQEYRLDPATVKVGILIAGGIAAGLNMVVDSIVKRHYLLATELENGHPAGLKILGIDLGYEGLKSGRLCRLAPSRGEARRISGNGEQLPVRSTDAHALAGGSTLVKAGRGSKKLEGEPAEKEAEAQAKKIVSTGLDVLYVIGGNGTLGWAARVHAALKRVAPDKQIVVLGGPKTMDADVGFADATFGFRTAVDQATDFVLGIHADAESQDRIGLLEVFGAYAGWVALHAYHLSGEGDVVLIPELAPKDRAAYEDYFTGMLEYVKSRVNAKQHAAVVVAEGAMPEFKFADAGSRQDAFANLYAKFKKYFDRGISAVPSRYLVRSTPPDSFDLELCKVTGRLMVESALAGYTGCTVNRWQNDFVLVPFRTATERYRCVPLWNCFLQMFLDKWRLQRLKHATQNAPARPVTS